MRAMSPLRLGIRAPATSPISAGSERSRTRSSRPCYAKAKAPCLFSVKFQSRSQSERALEVAMPALYPVSTSGLPPLDPGAVPFLVGVELVEVANPSELVDAVLERKDP